MLPKIDWVEPLRREAEHFLESIRHGLTPMTGIAHARQVVGILERSGQPQVA